MSANSQTTSSQLPAASVALTDVQWSLVNQALTTLSPQQMLWLSGYLAGMAQSAQVPVGLVQPQDIKQSLTILYGSQTGNAKAIASELKSKFAEQNVPVSLFNMADYKHKQLKSETHLVVVVSTHGEGDAPDDAVELHQFLASKKVGKLDQLSYAVLGLGDSSYEFFCQTAKDFDQRLAKTGAKPLLERVDCDVDYEGVVATWTAQLLSKIQVELKQNPLITTSSTNSVIVATQGEQYSKKNPFTATLLQSQKITGRDSVKDIRHVEISLADSGIQYQPGDALGVWFQNDKVMVQALLDLLKIERETSISLAGQSMSVFDALLDKLELTQSYPTFVKAYNEVAQHAELAEKLADKAILRVYLAERQIIDVVRDFPATISAQQLVDALRNITPRLYSIASSQAEVEDEVHLTVATVEYQAHGSKHQGGASAFLTRRLEEGGELKVFVEPNTNFRLPENNDAPVIMIGPGTGIAPFRAFMQQRAVDEAQGKNWLFFGNPNYTQDFLYQVEWQRFVKDGVVDKVSLAFSRDQAEKIYVQHRILEQGAELFTWLQEGAYLYVCGDAEHMAKDVHEALISVVQQHGNKSAQEAESYLSDLRRAKRYQKDVY
ncbi:MAG: assimilatory sulfite reductase (NADPH) flavoprotein subunit [Paraglaciecola sp.]|nr:assimilatory sulfite reductase (NADPH) flavoprotein subunit [Paraglaciecola sp.]NCT47647.1 assimilatory sulfite reductase (NADPH) flavoprotein subunit [Paraglaciecola sp.]